MDVTPLVKAGQQIIQSYASGGFKVSGQAYEGAVVVMPEQTFDWAFKGAFADLSIDDFEIILQHQDRLDVVLLGCGPSMAFLPSDLRAALKQRGVSVDVMDTGAACRTVNVLIAEGRRVAAVLLPF